MKLPKLSIILSLISLALFYLSNEHQLWYFDVDKIFKGEYWRLITGHFIHADSVHLQWNMTALIILGGIVEQQNSHLFIRSLLFAIVVIDFVLLSPWSQLDIYCGLSGALNSLLVIALWLEWTKNHSFLILSLGLVCFFKIILEIQFDQSLLTQITWPAYPKAHLLGFLAGIGLLVNPMFMELRRKLIDESR